jgi:hypothetical protein
MGDDETDEAASPLIIPAAAFAIASFNAQGM